MTETTEKVPASAEAEVSTPAPAAEVARAAPKKSKGHKEAKKAKKTTPAEDAAAYDPLAVANAKDADDEDDAFDLMANAMDSFVRPTDYQIGDVVEGTVVSADRQFLYLDLGSKSEASISKESVTDAEGNCPEVGDRVEAYVVNLEMGNIELGKSLPGGDDVLATIEDAFHNQIPVEGTVTGRNKGGLDVTIYGKRAFCPISQVELRFCEDPDVHLNQTYQFRITEVKEKGRNIVVSRRALLEEANRELAAGVRAQIADGVEMVGKVTTLTNYGAFVDLGAGVEGLVHVSAISHHRVQDPADVLTVGQQVRVLIEKVNPDNDRISLSMKALEEDPWDQSVSGFQEGTTTTGKVVRLQPFGAFVELAPGIDGLIHISQISHKRISHPKEVLKEGDQVEVKVVNLDMEKRRIGLSMKELDFAGLPAAVEGELREGMTLEVIVDKVETFGVFVRLPQDKRGLIPNKELNAERASDIVKQYPGEKKIQACIIQIDGTGRLRLSEKAVGKQKERQEFSEYRKSATKETKQVFGTLGDLLKGMQK